MTIPGFGGLHPTTRRLLLSRTLRSIGQGALVVDFSLYLHALHWSGFAIGLVLTVLLPLMPVYWLASMVFLLRSVFNRGSVGARQALVVGLGAK